MKLQEAFMFWKVPKGVNKPAITSTRNLLLTCLLASTLSLNGCTPKRAQALREAAIAFGNQSSLTLDGMDKLIRSETEAPTMTDQEVSQIFLDIVLSPNIDRKKLIDYLNSEMPLKPFPGNSIEAERAISTFIGKLRYQYASLVSIYDDIEKAYITGENAVKKSKEPLQKLTAQMAYFALCTDAVPPRLITQRGTLIADVIRLREDYMKAQDESTKEKIRDRLVGQLSRLREIQNREKELQKAVIENATKASVLGLELVKKIDEYDQISLEDLSFLIPKALNAASLLSGQDTSLLRQKASEVLVTIQKDDDFRRVAELALKEVQPLSNATRSGYAPQACYPLTR
jgi:hypothetical protein